MRQFLAVLWTFEFLLHFYILNSYFLPTYKVGMNYAPIINKSNYLSENVLCSKNDKVVIFIIFLDSTKLKTVWTKITTFFKRRVSTIL